MQKDMTCNVISLSCNSLKPFLQFQKKLCSLQRNIRILLYTLYSPKQCKKLQFHHLLSHTYLIFKRPTNSLTIVDLSTYILSGGSISQYHVRHVN